MTDSTTLFRSRGALHSRAAPCGIATEPPHVPERRALARDLATLHAALS